LPASAELSAGHLARPGDRRCRARLPPPRREHRRYIYGLLMRELRRYERAANSRQCLVRSCHITYAALGPGRHTSFRLFVAAVPPSRATSAVSQTIRRSCAAIVWCALPSWRSRSASLISAAWRRHSDLRNARRSSSICTPGVTGIMKIARPGSGLEPARGLVWKSSRL